jgi:hypothetical protein
VLGTISISGAFAARRVLPDWWLLLLLAFELRRLPEDVDQALADLSANGATGSSGSERYAPASPASSS